jgi:hypothetical protein
MAMERQYAGDARVVPETSVKVLPKSVERRMTAVAAVGVEKVVMIAHVADTAPPNHDASPRLGIHDCP